MAATAFNVTNGGAVVFEGVDRSQLELDAVYSGKVGDAVEVIDDSGNAYYGSILEIDNGGVTYSLITITTVWTDFADTPVAAICYNVLTLLADPSHTNTSSPPVTSRWVATECQINFQLKRAEYNILNAGSTYYSPDDASAFELDVDYNGAVGDDVTVVDASGNTYTGEVLWIEAAGGTHQIIVGIAYATFADSVAYINKITGRENYYFEGRLTVNGVVQSLTVIASPNAAGIANLDVSGILRILVTIGKTGDNTATVMAETNKSGSFTFTYRGCWYGSEEAYTEEGNTWYYAEAVRSVEQGCNLYEYVPDDAADAPFFNTFERPVYFAGLPFDITFILPELAAVSPAAELTITRRHYDATNTLLSAVIENVTVSTMEGRICSLNIAPAGLEATAAYMTIEIAAP
jgi:hypothetical protein